MSVIPDQEIEQLYAARYRSERIYRQSPDLKDSLENSSAAESIKSNRSRRSKGSRTPIRNNYGERLYRTKSNTKNDINEISIQIPRSQKISPNRNKSPQRWQHIGGISESVNSHSPHDITNKGEFNQIKRRPSFQAFENLKVDTNISASHNISPGRYRDGGISKPPPRRVSKQWPPKSIDGFNKNFDGSSQDKINYSPSSQGQSLTPVESAIRNLLNQKDSPNQSSFQIGSQEFSYLKPNDKPSPTDKLSRRPSLMRIGTQDKRFSDLSPNTQKTLINHDHRVIETKPHGDLQKDLAPIHSTSPFIFGEKQYNQSNNNSPKTYDDFTNYHHSPRSRNYNPHKEFGSPAGLLAFVTNESSVHELPDKIKGYMIETSNFKDKKHNENAFNKKQEHGLIMNTFANMSLENNDIEKNMRHQNAVRVLPSLKGSEDLVRVLRKNAERNDAESPEAFKKESIHKPLIDITNESEVKTMQYNFLKPNYNLQKENETLKTRVLSRKQDQQNVPPNKESFPGKLGRSVSKSITRSMSMSINRSVSKTLARRIKRRESLREDLTGLMRSEHEEIHARISGSSMSSISRKPGFNQSAKNYQSLENEAESGSLLSVPTERSQEDSKGERLPKRLRTSKNKNSKYRPESRTSSLPHPIDASVLGEVSMKDKYPEKFWTFTTSVVLPDFESQSKLAHKDILHLT